MIGRLLLLAAGAALLAALLEWRLLDPTPEEPAGDTARPGYYLTGVELQEFGVDGQPRLALRAATASEDLDSGRIALAEVGLDYRATATEQDWRLTADRARVARGGEVVEFEGNVTMSGQGARLPAGSQLRAARLTLDTARETARSDTLVTLALGPHELHARGLQADLKAGTLRLETEVNGRFSP